MGHLHADNHVRIFLSYSRAQFYFAESLAHGLAARDFVVWFDWQQLETGEDWATEIATGLEESHVLVLVGSEHALSSAAVRQEWATALALGKTVVVALFEYVELPSELQGSFVVDFRRSFGAGLARLESVLHGRNVPVAGQAAIRRGVLTPAVRVVAWSLAVPAWVGLCVVAFAVARMPYAGNVRADIALCGYTGFLCVFLLRRRRSFLTRSFRRSQTQVALMICGSILPLATGRALSATGLPSALALIIVLLLIASTVLALVGSWQLQRNPEIFRWLPTGEARNRERRRNAGASSIANAAPKPIEGRKPRFWIRFDPGDRYVAGIVARQFARAGWEKAATQEAADRHLAIVSGETDVDQIAAAYRSGLLPVVVVASNGVREEVFGALARHQWIDFRRRRLHDLRKAGRQLRAGGTSTRSIELNAVPERLWVPVQPFHIRLVLRLVDVTCLVLLVLAVMLVMLHAVRALLAIFAPSEARQLQDLLQVVFDNVQKTVVPHAQRDWRGRMADGFVNAIFFSPLAAWSLAAIVMSVVVGLAWLANAVSARKLSHRAALMTGGLLSLGWLDVFYPVMPFLPLFGLIGLVLLIGEIRHAWFPGATRTFRTRAIEAFVDLAGWRRTATAVGLLFALLYVGVMFVMSLG